MKIVLTILVASMPFAALAAGAKANRAPQKAADSARQTTNNGVASKAGQGVGSTVKGSGSVGGN